ATFGLTILGMAAAYGVVCGSMMLAGERESGTLVLLDIFLGRRGLLWSGKLAIGIVLAITEGLAVALVLYLFKQMPPEWMAPLVGRGREGAVGLRQEVFQPTLGFWFLVLPLVTLEAYAWGMLGSALSNRVIAGAAAAAVIATPFWSIAIAFPAPIGLGFRIAE